MKPSIEAATIQNLASSDRLLRVRVALAVTEHASESKDAADDTAGALRRAIDDSRPSPVKSR
jgi:hypothetical protein